MKGLLLFFFFFGIAICQDQVWYFPTLTGSTPIRANFAWGVANNTFIVAGGQSTFSGTLTTTTYLINLLTNSATLAASFTTARQGARGVVYGGFFYMFGGIDSNLFYRTDFQRYNFATDAWSSVSVTGASPVGCYGYSAALAGNLFFIHGGRTSGTATTSSLRTLNLDTFVYSVVSTTGSPHNGAEGATVVSLPDTLLFLGGSYLIGGNTFYSSSLTKYTISTSTWSSVSATGQVPSARYYHTASLIGEVMYIFSGLSQTGNYLGSFLGLNTTSFNWFSPGGTLPSSRQQFGSVAVGDTMWIFGGKTSVVLLTGYAYFDSNVPWVTTESTTAVLQTTQEQTTQEETTAQQTTVSTTVLQQTTALVQTTAIRTTSLQTTALRTTSVQTTQSIQTTQGLQTTQQQTTSQQTTEFQDTTETVQEIVSTNSKKNLSNNVIVALAICVPIGFMLLLVSALLFYFFIVKQPSNID